MSEKLDVNLGCPYGAARPERWHKSKELEAPTGSPPHIWTDAEKLALANAVALLDAREQLAAKDAEIAELRRRLEIFQDAERGALQLAGIATAERDEARECVGRLYGILRLIYMSGEIDPGFWDEALAATPEHLRDIRHSE